MAKRKPSAFAQARRAETQFARQLRKVAAHVGDIVKAFPPGTPDSARRIGQALRQYSRAIEPWARANAERMIAEVMKRDERGWVTTGKEIGRELRRELSSTPMQAAMQTLLQEQVDLITSLPTEAAERVHELTREMVMRSGRASEIVDEIMKTGEVTKSRANLIARTETARTSATITMRRAESIGSKGYIWRTAEDSDVRPSHRKMNGQFVPWGPPPLLSDGTRAHAGMIYNCRCYMEPVIPDEL